jgi:DNA polymerase-3 subunit epsilon
MREICLDTETTGLDPRDGHKVIEIAAFEIVNKVKTGNYFHCYINPNRNVPHEAFLVHGISTEFLLDKPIFANVANEFLDFIKNDPLVIHNAMFDLKFLNFELNNIGSPLLTQNKIIDTLTLARQKFPNSPNSLDALCKRFKIDLSKREKHSALIDTELLCLVYLELTCGSQGGFSFSKKDDVNEKTTTTEFVKQQYNLPKRDFSLTKQQLELHQEFILNNFKKNSWYNT